MTNKEKLLEIARVMRLGIQNTATLLVELEEKCTILEAISDESPEEECAIFVEVECSESPAIAELVAELEANQALN